MKFFLLIYFCLTAFFINVNAAEATSYSMSDNDTSLSDCITATFDQIYLTNDGMFVHIDQEFIPVYALYSYEVNQYRCDIHNRIEDLITCEDCGIVYDRYKYKSCPNRMCPSRFPNRKH